MILWRDKATGDTCRIQIADYDMALDLTAVLVMYFGGDGPNEADWMTDEEFFETHEPEGFHS